MWRQGTASIRRRFRRERVLGEYNTWVSTPETRSHREMKYHALPGRFPPIAVKLNGETARTKPSSARYSMRLFFYVPGLAFPDRGYNDGNRVNLLPGTGRVFGWLLGIQFFHELDAEAQKVSQLLKKRIKIMLWIRPDMWMARPRQRRQSQPAMRSSLGREWSQPSACIDTSR